MTSPDLDFLAALAAARAPADAFTALDHLVQRRLGAKLVTVMTVESAGTLARRADAYPVSGTKPVEDNCWTRAVIHRGETFVANTLAAIAEVFPDHELIGSLGLSSVVNLPVSLGGEVLATLNLLDAEGYFAPERVTLLQSHLALPTLAAQLAYDRLR
jgi:hypothetical protein